jgi:aspartate aminotransferase
MQFAVEAALRGDRSHQASFVRELKMRADLTVSRLTASPFLKCAAPEAAFYVMPQMRLAPGQTDEDFVLGLLRETGILCVYGSGFGMPADQGFFRIVYLASQDELSAIYDDLVAYAGEFAGRSSAR